MQTQLQVVLHNANAAMRTAEESIRAWLRSGDVTAWLYIEDDTVVTLPTLPATLTRLRCYRCLALVSLGELPATLECLYCWVCPTLASMPRLPAALTRLDCWACPALRMPDAYPAGLRLGDRSAEDSRVAWRADVAARHWADRRRVAAALPPLALLYV
jgi:hypothetical protein